MSSRGVLVAEKTVGEFSAVSVVIPSYRGNERLVRLIKALSNCNYPSLEIIVVVDEPLESVSEELMKIRNAKVKVILNTRRAGKVNALNTAVRHSRGDIIIFLDDDVEIVDADFIEKIVEGMKDSDIADIKKIVVEKGLLGKMVYIEYTATNFASKLMARLAKRTVAINGAAFAMKRKALEEIGYFKPIISEDFDLAIRSFLKGHKYTYIDSTYVLNYPPESWRKWYKQRKRWAIGVADWLQSYYKVGFKALIEMPHVITPGLVLSLPSIVSTILPFFLYNHTVAKGLYLFLLSLSSVTSQVIPFATLLSVNLQLVYILPLLVTMVFFMLWHFLASRYVGMRSYLYLYPLYFIVYQPLWFTILLAGFIRRIILGRKDLEDWIV